MSSKCLKIAFSTLVLSKDTESIQLVFFKTTIYKVLDILPIFIPIGYYIQIHRHRFIDFIVLKLK